MTANDIARSGYKAYLKALGKTKAELLTMAAAVESGIEETIITSLGSEGASSAAQLSALMRHCSRMSIGAPASMPRAIASKAACIISSGLMASNAPRLPNGRASDSTK